MLPLRSLLLLATLGLTEALLANGSSNVNQTVTSTNSSRILVSGTLSASLNGTYAAPHSSTTPTGASLGTFTSSDYAPAPASTRSTVSSSSSASGSDNATNGIGHYVLLGLGLSTSEVATTVQSSLSAFLTNTSVLGNATRTLLAASNTTALPNITNVANTTSTPSLTVFLNSSLASTGSGSRYASQCNAIWSVWSESSLDNPYSLITTTSWFTYTNWTASTTTLGGCDDHPRLVGSFTPIATGTNSTTYPIDTQAGFTQPAPSCSVNPSDCQNVYEAWNTSTSSYFSAWTAAQTNVSLAPGATAVVIGTSTTYFGSVGSTLPLITVNGTAYSGTITTNTYSLVYPTSTISVDTDTHYSFPWSPNEYLIPNDYVVFQGPLPDYPGNAPTCNRSIDAAGCGGCTIYGGQVQLLYFPPTNASRNMCASEPPDPTTCPLGPTTAPYAPAGVGLPGVCTEFIGCPYALNNKSTTNDGPYIVSQGTTFHENRAYISLQTVYASNSCGTVGRPHAGSILTLASSQIYSVRRLHYQCADYGYSFNFGDLEPNLPFSAFNVEEESPGCYPPENLPYPNWMDFDWVNGEQLQYTQPCGTIIDWAYFPTLVVPTEIRTLDPAWASCAVELEGLYDPPKALSAVTTEAGVSQPGVQTTTAASPASTPSHAAASPTAPSTTAPPTPVAESTVPKAPAPQSTAPAASPAQSSSSKAPALQNTAPHSTAPAPEANSAPPTEDPTSAAAQSSATGPGEQAGAQATSNAGQTTPGTATGDGGNAGGAIASLLGNTASSAGDADPTAQSVVADPGQSAAPATSQQGAAGAGASLLGDSGSSTAMEGQDPASQDPGVDVQTPAAEASTPSPSTGDPGNDGSSVQSAVVFTAQGSTHTAIPVAGSSGAFAVDGSTIQVGSSGAVVHGATLSVGSSGLDVDGTPVASDTDQAANTNPVIFTANGATYTPSPVAGSSGYYAVDGTTLSPQGTAAKINGATVSAGSSGLLVGGSTAAAASDPSQPGDVVFTTNGAIYTATPVAGSSGAYVIGSSTISAGGSVIIADGLTLSALPSGLLVDGSTALVTPAASPASGAVLKLGSATLSATQTVVTGSNGQLTTEALVGGITLVQGGPSASVSGHVVSLGSEGVVVDGTQTQPITALPAGSAASGAVLALGSSTLSAVQTVLTGSNGQLTTEALIDGSTLVEGGSPVTLNGHTLSFGFSGIVVDGTQTQQLSAIADPSISGALIPLGSTTLSAVEAVITGSNGQLTTEAIVDGSTLMEGSAPVTIDGHTISFGSNGQLVIDGTRTQSLSALEASSTTAGGDLAPVVFTEDGRTFTATPVAGKTGVYVVDGKTVSSGGPDVVVDGITLSAQSTDLLVDGAQTVAFTSTESGRGGGQTTALSTGMQPSTSSRTTTSAGSGPLAVLPRAMCVVLLAIMLSILV